MVLGKRSKKDEIKYDMTKKIEEVKRKITLLKAKLFNKGIDPEDTRTIQVHKDVKGNFRDYYISNPYLQENISYTNVNALIEDYEHNKFVYKGLVGSANNAFGIIEANVPLSEIVSSPEGNVKLQEMLSQENATAVRDKYYDKIGEEKETGSYFTKPEFTLGTIQKGENGEFVFSSETTTETEEMMTRDREETKREELMRNKESVEINFGGGMVIAKQDCWLEQGKGIQFAGTNRDALFYRYSPGKPIETEDKKYVYIGQTEIGEGKVLNQNSGEPIQFVSPFKYRNVVLWTDGQNLIQYFLDKKLSGLNMILGEVFTNQNFKATIEKGEQIFAGGITIDEEGKCKKIDNIPETVKKAVEEYWEHLKEKSENKIIDIKER